MIPGRLPENGSMVPSLGVLPTCTLISDRRRRRGKETYSYRETARDTEDS